jgi:hypothetical protein
LLGADKLRFVVAIRYRRQHGVGNMPDSPKASGFQRQPGGGNIHAHSADYDRHYLALAKAHAEIVYTFHYYKFFLTAKSRGAKNATDGAILKVELNEFDPKWTKKFCLSLYRSASA